MRKEIVVKISPQEWSVKKYLGNQCQCYLEEALRLQGFTDIKIMGNGYAKINGVLWIPEKPFDGMRLKHAFYRKESVTVTLI